MMCFFMKKSYYLTEIQDSQIFKPVSHDIVDGARLGQNSSNVATASPLSEKYFSRRLKCS